MVPALRQRHRQIWRVLALLLPVAYISALVTLRPPVVRPGELPFQLPGPATSGMEQSGFLVIVRDAAGESPRMLEVQVLQPLTVPAAVVFLQTEGASRQALGQLGPVGVYRFPLGSVSAGAAITIVDPLNDTSLLTTQIE